MLNSHLLPSSTSISSFPNQTKQICLLRPITSANWRTFSSQLQHHFVANAWLFPQASVKLVRRGRGVLVDACALPDDVGVVWPISRLQPLSTTSNVALIAAASAIAPRAYRTKKNLVVPDFLSYLKLLPTAFVFACESYHIYTAKTLPFCRALVISADVLPALSSIRHLLPAFNLTPIIFEH